MNGGSPAVLDHPIFSESIRRIRQLLGERAASDPALAAQLAALTPLERDLLERCIHSSGDPSIAVDLRFSPAGAFCGEGGAGAAGAAALAAGALILTDTAMAAAAVTPMARRTFGNPVACVLDWAPAGAPAGSTRAAAGMRAALAELAESGQRPALVLIGSAPTALDVLLDQTAAAVAPPPALVIGMPVGFVGVAESKRHLAASGLAHVRLEGSKGGAGLVAAACNALLRGAWLQAASVPPT
ncbi:MAG: precorrin-8X methylmutase [Cyanobium sp.]|jgi:precorrin-8X/cobalt-precorrin-8 methylmutase|nr:precorrin-8X methylmutase [Cyanobium sp.]